MRREVGKNMSLFGFDENKNKISVSGGADSRDYTKAEVDTLLTGKANTEHSHSTYELPINAIIMRECDVANGGMDYGTWYKTMVTTIEAQGGSFSLNYSVYQRVY